MIEGLKPYAEYKESGLPWLGGIPRHWNSGPGFAAFREKQVKNTGIQEKTVLSLSYGRIVVKPPEKLHGLVPDSFETYQIVAPGDIIIRSTDLQNDWNSLRVGLVRNRGIITSAYLCFRTTDVLIPEYGYQLLHAFDLMKVFYGLGSGLRQNLDWGDFKRMPIFIPPPEEQAAIVRFLDFANGRLERAIRAKRKVIALLHEQKQAIIHRAVTRGLDPNVRLKPSGVAWLGDVPQHWEVWQIGHFAKVGNGSTPSRGNTSYWSGGTYPWLNSSSVNAGTVTTSDQYVTEVALRECHLPRVPAGSVLVAITGQGKTRGKAAVLSIEATINQHIAFITLRKPGEIVTAEYLQKFLVAAYAELRRMSDDSGSTKGALTCEDLRHLRVVLPPIPAQEAILQSIGDGLAEVERALRIAESEIDLLHEYRTRLIADVVTGKLDVREAAARLPEEAEELEPLDETEVLGEMEGEAAADDLDPEPQEAEA